MRRVDKFKCLEASRHLNLSTLLMYYYVVPRPTLPISNSKIIIKQGFGAATGPGTLWFQACTGPEVKTVEALLRVLIKQIGAWILLHCAERSTPWLLDTAGCDRDVECFSLFEHYVTLPVGTWSIAFEQSFRSQCSWLLRSSQSHDFVLRGKRNKLFR